MLPPHNVKEKNSKKYGSILPYRISQKRPLANGTRLFFYISSIDYIHLSDGRGGEGRCYAYLEDFKKWCEVRIYKYWVIHFRVIKDTETLKEIEEEILS